MIRQRHPLARGAPPARTARPKKVNRARKNREWTRAYGSPERVAWVNSRRCIVGLLCTGAVQNAHVGKVGAGAGRKANADQIVPLCERHHFQCHEGQQSLAKRFGIDFDAEAAAVESAWRAQRGEDA